jgi:hypothetical protein
MPKKKILEKQIKESINKMLDNIPESKFFPYNPYYGEAGIPDIIGVMRVVITPDMVNKEVGLFVGIEVKREGEKPTKLQAMQINKMKASGGMAFVARSSEDAYITLKNYMEYYGAKKQLFKEI